MNGESGQTSLRHRLAGGAVAAIASGAAVGLFVLFQVLTAGTTASGIDPTAFGLVFLAVGAVGCIIYTVGVGISILIDRLVPPLPSASIAAHLVAGAVVGISVVWYLAVDLTAWGAITGATIGSVNAGIAIAVARTRPEGSWTRPAVLLVGAASVASLILLSAT